MLPVWVLEALPVPPGSCRAPAGGVGPALPSPAPGTAAQELVLGGSSSPRARGGSHGREQDLPFLQRLIRDLLGKPVVEAWFIFPRQMSGFALSALTV